jgi:putative ABC transport system permease protein
MSALTRKLLRDLLRLKGQGLTIALVIASGIAAYVSVASTWDSLVVSTSTYYERERFGDVFAHLERAPLSVAAQLEGVSGVAISYPRIMKAVLVPLPGKPEPATAQVVSIPDRGDPPLCGIFVKQGRLPEDGRDDEVALLEQFAEKYALTVGDTIPVVLNGTLRELRIVGLAMSPEFVFPATSGAMDADQQSGVLWMRSRVVAAAFRMEGAFNDVVVRTQPGALEADVLAGVDRVLRPWGGLGAVGRKLQASNYVVQGELTSLEGMATTVPTLFLAVAAFLLNVVLSRTIALQRGQVAVLKAVGYSNYEVAMHYLGLVLLVAGFGAALGIGVGRWMGGGLASMYSDIFRFPSQLYRLSPAIVAKSVFAAAFAAFVGAFQSLRSVMKLPPAEAMRPASPVRYRSTWFSRVGAGLLFEVSGRLVVREIERQPLRTFFSSIGIAMAIGIVIVGRFFSDAMGFLQEEVFEHAMREDLALSFAVPVPVSTLGSLASLPGVERVEGERVMPVRFRFGPFRRDGAIFGHQASAELRLVIDEDGRVVETPRHGLLLSRKLAEILGVRVGDDVEIELLEGDRGTRKARVAALVNDMYGLLGYMDADELRRFAREEAAVSIAYLKVNPLAMNDVRARLSKMRGIVRVSRREAMLEQFRKDTGKSMGIMTLTLTFFAIVIAIGIVYNNARVALSTRSRDLASLRVLGMTRGEVGAVLIGELGVQLALGIPIGLLLGRWWAAAMMSTWDAERYRLPLIISSQTYLFAVLVTLAAGVVSALLVRRRLNELDLVGVLKDRE